MPLGIVISNHNMGHKTVECISSVFNSNMQSAQIFAVDMASSDNSVSVIKERFGSQISLTCCNEDLSGSGRHLMQDATMSVVLEKP